MAQYSNPTPDKHLEVLYRQTFNTLGAIVAGGLTQDNRVGNVQKTANTRLDDNTPKGILGGSVVAVAGAGTIGACAGDSSVCDDKAVGIAVNNAVGNPWESSSAVASGKCVYAHGTGTVIRTDLYETQNPGGGALTYAAGDKVYSSQNGLLQKRGSDGTGILTVETDTTGLCFTAVGGHATAVGIILDPPAAGNGYMTVQLRI